MLHQIRDCAAHCNVVTSKNVYIYIHTHTYTCICFPGGSVVKNLPASAGDTGSFPRLERSAGKGNGNLPQYSCLENSIDREPGGL